jgi:uncharacterized OB-fold protein
MTGTMPAAGTDDDTAPPGVVSGAESKEVRPGLFDRQTPQALRPGERASLAASSCGYCGRLEFPARSRCPACGTDAQLIALSPDARLSAFTMVLHAVPGARVQPPYHVGVAEFGEGIAVLGILLAEDGVHIGQAVETVVHEPFDGSITYAFRAVPDKLPPDLGVSCPRQASA